MFKLESLIGQRNIIIEENEIITIGRSEENSVVLDINSISSKHCIVQTKGDSLFITDLASTNGTFIDGFLLEANKEYPLNIEQTLIIGTGGIQYQLVYNNKHTKLVNPEQISGKPKDRYTIGRKSTNDLIVNSPNVSNTHLIVTKVGDSWEIEDVSTNGTYLNSFDNRITRAELQRDQILYLANYKLSTNRIFQLVEEDSAVKQKIDFNKDEIILGRGVDCDLTLNNPNISSKHAKIINENGNYYILDLKSTNGTFVNYNPIKGKTKIKEGDRITLGIYTFEFSINQQQQKFTLLQSDIGIRVDVKNVSYIVDDDNNKKGEKKAILDDISLSIYAGELVGLMGLSGAGKTTLLDAMSGYIKATEGSIHINGIELYRNFEILKQYIGYVPQDDIIHPELTVYESLSYSAKLRLDLSQKEIDERIDKVLEDLGISTIKNSRIGSADKKGISGGQRRRVNLAVELIAEPELIFLDEPTSGLSSVDTKSVIETLKKLTDAGKTIIITIHQPSLSNYKMMDNIIILTNGQCAYYGQNHPNSIKFFNNNTDDTEILSDADNALIGLDRGEKQNIVWKDRYQKSKIYKEYVIDRINKPNTVASDKMNKKKKDSSFKQFFILSSRYFKVKLKDGLNTSILISQSPLIAILLILMFYKNWEGYKIYESSPQVLLFIIIISSVWFGMNNAVREIVSEKTIFKKERLLGLKIVPYVLSKFIILSFLALVQVSMLVLIVNYGGVPLKTDIPLLILLSFISSLSGISIGLLLSSWVKTQASALSMLPILLLPMIVLSGGMVSVRDMPYGVHMVSLTMPTRFTLEETIRVYDNYNSDIDKLREPYQNEDNPSRAVFNITIDEVKPMDYLTTNESTLCQDKRCIEALYMVIKQEGDDINSTIFKEDSYRAHPNKTIMYSIFLLFIFAPLLLTMFVIKREYRIK